MGTGLPTTVVGIFMTAVLAFPDYGMEGVTVETDGEVCENMCIANFSDVFEECTFGCSQRTGLRERINPFNTCFSSCENRFKDNLLSLHNDSDFVNRAWDACLHACQLPYKTNFRWNVYVDLRSGEPTWNFERILNDGPKVRSVGVGFDDLVSSVSLQPIHDLPLYPDFSPRFGAFRNHRPASDEQVLQGIMLEMLHRVRMEMSKIAPHRFDGFTSFNYIGPRIVESGPHGPFVTDITELEYRPKDVLIFNSHDTHRDRKIMVIYFLLFAFLCTMVCALIHLRRYHDTLQRIRMRRAQMANNQMIESDFDSAEWTKRIPPGTAPPSYSSPDKD